MAKKREELHKIIDYLPEEKLPSINEWLKKIYEEEKKEELNKATIKEINEAEYRIKKGEYVTLDDLLKDDDA